MKKKAFLLLKTGKRYSFPSFRVYFKPSADYKTGFIAGRKIGSASKRSRLKRIIREFWRKNFKAGDYLFILKEGIEPSGREKILGELEIAAERVKCKSS
ncbi:MAG: ribonuclease P protein component [Candidatus Omnitrophica bacterium]|nr:ribonuclease P protein component [Candidatus Omnitrophota bacterium]